MEYNKSITTGISIGMDTIGRIVITFKPSLAKDNSGVFKIGLTALFDVNNVRLFETNIYKTIIAKDKKYEVKIFQSEEKADEYYKHNKLNILEAYKELIEVIDYEEMITLLISLNENDVYKLKNY